METPPHFSTGSIPRFTEDLKDGAEAEKTFDGSSCNLYPNADARSESNASPPYQEFNENHTSHRSHVSGQYQPLHVPRHGLPAPSFGSHEHNAQHTPVDGLHHRLSDKQRPYSPSEVVSPLPESVRHDWDEKEVAIPPAFPEVYEPPRVERPRPRKRICGLPEKLFFLLLAVLIVLAIALGVGLGVGLGLRHSSKSSTAITDSSYLIGGALDAQYFSTSGAFNGSGIALAQQSFTQDLSAGTQGTVVLYFQHWSGQIRWQRLSNSGEWLGGDVTSIVAADAKNSTPLSAVSYVSEDVSTWHIFYVNTNNTLSQKTNSNVTNNWVDGPLTAMKLPVLDADEVGMQACWYGNDYGGSNYTHTPLPGHSGNLTSSNESGMYLWYASDNSTFQQYGWRPDDDVWTFQREWPDKNGHAGVGCYTWGPGSVTYAMFVNTENTVEFWWKDSNTNLTNTTAHPVNVWVNSSIAINNVYPSSALGFTNYFYAQMADDLMFDGYNITWAAENTTLADSETFTVAGDPGLPGSHLSVTAIPNISGGSQILVFYQTNGTDISEYTRDIVAGQWSTVSLPIPYS